MQLADALSQLAILGATSIVLRNGRVVQLAEPDGLLAEHDVRQELTLRAREWWLDVVDESGQIFGRAVTLWLLPMEPLLAAGG